ncbi:KAP family P-loop NTPase fold protein [Porphyromonas sp.]
MSTNNESQNQDAGNPSPSQEATSESKVPSLQEVHKAASEPQASPVKTACKASPSLLRKCWDKLRVCPSTIRWEPTDRLEDISGVLAEVGVPIVLWIFFIFLHKPIEEFAVKLLVAPVLAHFDTGTLSSLLGIGLALILLLRFIQLGWRHYIVGGKVVLSASLILAVYLYYRFGRPDFEFYGLFGQTWPIAFADLIPLACFLTILLKAWTYCTKRRAAGERQAAESVEGFLTDHPLTEEEEALSGWTSQAQTLTQKLLATDTTRAAFSLGIVASWGEGKSSFMGIMQRYLRRVHREVIIMRFNPWLYDKEAPLTKVFFEELRRTLAPYSSKLSRSIDSYAELLLAVDNGWLKLVHQPLRQPQRSTAKQFDQLSRNIQELGRKVVIFIDDVDRLTREELMELFNLVRNSSNLPCLYFVLAYDKSYVLKTLQSDGEHMSRYPEKILQEEYPLPKLTPDKMWTVLERCLNETQFGKENEDKTQGGKDNQTEDKENKVSTLLRELKKEGVNLPYHLTTIRMVKRIVNAFNSRYDLLHKVGVAPFDLFIFELIYYVYPKVYDLLLEMHKKAIASLDASPKEGRTYSTYRLCPIFFSHTNGKGMQYISLHSEGEASSDLYDEASWNTYPVVDALKKLDFGLKDGYKEDIVVGNIVELLELLWGKKRKPALGQINHETYWRRYFYRGLQVGELSQEEFASFLTNPDRSKRKQCLERWSQEKPIAFMQEVLGYTPMNRDEMEPIVYAMFDWNTIQSGGMTFNCVEIDYLIRKAKPTNNWVKREFPKILQDKDVLSATFDYTVRWLQHRFPEAAILPKDSLRKNQEAIFKKLAEKEDCLDLYIKYWLKAQWEVIINAEQRTPWLDGHMRKLIIKYRIDKFSKHILSRSQVEGGFRYWLHDLPWENLTALAKDVRGHSQDEGENSFLRFVELALEEEKKLANNGKLEFKTGWRVKVILTPEQWEPKEEPYFLLRTNSESDGRYPFYSYPPDANES